MYHYSKIRNAFLVIAETYLRKIDSDLKSGRYLLSIDTLALETSVYARHLNKVQLKLKDLGKLVSLLMSRDED